MHNQNLIASVALFRELYNNEKYNGLPEIIGDFIINAIKLNNCWICNSMDLKNLLKSQYSFDIPEAVIRTTVKRLIKKEKVVRKDNEYHFKQNPDTDTFIQVQQRIDSITNEQQDVFGELCSFIEEKKKIILTDIDKDKIFQSFIHFFLTSNATSEDYMDFISAFFISKNNDKKIEGIIKSIKEGIVLYKGITTTANITDFGKWTGNLVIYLATEHLFNAVGYNGLLYQEIFNDFLSLVNDINRIAKKKSNKKTIELRYLGETEKEVDDYFEAAENILRKGTPMLGQKPAMKSILKDSKKLSDIKIKKVNFKDELRRKGILCVSTNNNETIYKYNLEYERCIDDLKKRGKDFDEKECLNILSLFTKINTERKGINNTSFEQIKYIYMTESSLAIYLAHNNIGKIKEKDFPFAKSIDFFITQFWYKLNKGFSTQNLPISFEIITKAKIVLSTYISKDFLRYYEEICQEYKNGELTEEKVGLLIQELRNKPQIPDDISEKNIDDTLAFIQNKDFIENVYRENSLKSQKLKEQDEELKNKDDIIKNKDRELEKYRTEERKKKIEGEAMEFAQNEWKRYFKRVFKDLVCFVVFVIIDVILLLLTICGGLFAFTEKIGVYIPRIWMVILIVIFIGFVLFQRYHWKDKKCFINVRSFIKNTLKERFHYKKTYLNTSKDNYIQQNM